MSGLRTALGTLPDATFADLLESDDAYLLVVDLPGVTADTLEVTATRNRLRIEAHRDKPAAVGYRFVQERRDAFVDVDLPLPPDAVGEEASASIERGVLELTIPRRAGGGIEIEVADA